MAELCDDPESYFVRATAKSRVLLINPPVEERRYHWLRWNQPLDLLKLSTWLKKKRRGIDVKLYDFMLPSDVGAVPKRVVKEHADGVLWHFGRRYEEFGDWFSGVVDADGWLPTFVVITSLTSYWSRSIEKLLTQLLQRLGPKHRKSVRVCLYGAYPRFEPDDAETQYADVAFTRTVDTSDCIPDHRLYLVGPDGRLPNFAALDIRDSNVDEQVEKLLRLKEQEARKRANTRAQSLTVAFFNEDVAREKGNLARLSQLVQQKLVGRVAIEGICGIEPRSLGEEELELMRLAGFRSLFVEHARREDGSLDRHAYRWILAELERVRRTRRQGEPTWLARPGATGFVYVGRPEDDLEEIVEAALELNEMFGSVIMKPFGWDPELGPPDRAELRSEPREASPQWYPYVDPGKQRDYENLMRFQTILNMRVKGSTFDFLDRGNVARLVRETLVQESWKRHPDQ